MSREGLHFHRNFIFKVVAALYKVHCQHAKEYCRAREKGQCRRAMMMPKDEFEKLCADRKKLIVESSSLPDTVAPNPVSMLIADSDSTNNTTVDTLENEG